MRYLHTMLRVADPEAAIRFFKLLGLKETRRMENQAGRYTLIYLAADEDFRGDGEQGEAEVELTYDWPPEDAALPRLIPGAAISATSPPGSTTSTKRARGCRRAV